MESKMVRKVASKKKTFSLILFPSSLPPLPLPQNHQAFVEEAADYDAALADGARARVRVRGPTAAALRAAAAAKAAAAAAAAGTAAATGRSGGGSRARRSPPSSSAGRTSSPLRCSRSSAPSPRSWTFSCLSWASTRAPGPKPRGSGALPSPRPGSLATAATAPAAAPAAAKKRKVRLDRRFEGRGARRGVARRRGPGQAGQVRPRGRRLARVQRGAELGRRGLGPRCLLSLALLAAWRAPPPPRAPAVLAPPVTPLDLVRGAACGSIPFLDLSPFAAAAVAAAAAAAAAGAGRRQQTAMATLLRRSSPCRRAWRPCRSSPPAPEAPLAPWGRPRRGQGSEARAGAPGQDDYGALPPAVPSLLLVLLLSSRRSQTRRPSPPGGSPRWGLPRSSPRGGGALPPVGPLRALRGRGGEQQEKDAWVEEEEGEEEEEKRTEESSSSESGSESGGAAPAAKARRTKGTATTMKTKAAEQSPAGDGDSSSSSSGLLRLLPPSPAPRCRRSPTTCGSTPSEPWPPPSCSLSSSATVSGGLRTG